ncbi:hypothetical protein THIX_30650 [Thiomonas sp. X19]|nr:hypothetical protein THIX_10307 [Thiomonas sp. X19]SCC93422.1 hypothetical protein THIX_30650 [Thiomonas sp. X19]
MGDAAAPQHQRFDAHKQSALALIKHSAQNLPSPLDRGFALHPARLVLLL